MTGDVGSAPALARRRRIPAAGCNPGEYGLKAIERTNQTTQDHVMQYLARQPAPCDDPYSYLYAESSDAGTVISYIMAHT